MGDRTNNQGSCWGSFTYTLGGACPTTGIQWSSVDHIYATDQAFVALPGFQAQATQVGVGVCRRGSDTGDLDHLGNYGYTHESCAAACLANSECGSFTDGHPNGAWPGYCWLHSISANRANGDTNYRCWLRSEVSQPTPLPTQATSTTPAHSPSIIIAISVGDACCCVVLCAGLSLNHYRHGRVRSDAGTLSLPGTATSSTATSSTAQADLERNAVVP